MKKGYLYILLATVLFSTMEIALKVVTNSFNPIQMTFLRFLIGSIILLPLAIKGLRSRDFHPKTGDLAFFALTGFICVVVSMVLYQMAIFYSQAAIVAILFSVNPVFVVLFAFLLLHEKIYLHTVISIIISIAGIIVIMNPLHMSGTALGIVLTILSAIAFAFYNVVGRTRSDRYGGIAMTCFSFMFGSMEMLLLIFLSRISAVATFLTQVGLKSFADVPLLQGISLHTLPNLIYIGIFVTGLGYTFYFLAMETTSAAKASLVFFIKPVLAPILALILIHETITLNVVTGILLIIIGSLISFYPSLKLLFNGSPILVDKSPRR
ncbi:MAG TPA: DMT family transporter [Desulfobacteria bacterium]|nr:DMT family transporter [Desulfobacteria bacterium]